MQREELEALRDRVLCGAVLEKAGFAIDLQESTRKAVKYRRGKAIVIVIHKGRGWFDPLSEAKGDVFRLVAHLDGAPFVEVLDQVASLVSFVPREPVWTRPARQPGWPGPIGERWSKRRKPWPGSMTWRYLTNERCLPDALIRAAVRQNVLREGPQGSMWAAHRDGNGAITGWEERGPAWRGFSTGGAKILFRLGPTAALRLCMTEAAIDAMSLATIEDGRSDSLYLSTGGGWAPATEVAIRALIAREGSLLVAATDNNPQGEKYAERLKAAAIESGCGFERLRPAQVDWNAELTARRWNRDEEAKEGREPAACPPAASREASPGCAGP